MQFRDGSARRSHERHRLARATPGFHREHQLTIGREQSRRRRRRWSERIGRDGEHQLTGAELDVKQASVVAFLVTSQQRLEVRRSRNRGSWRGSGPNLVSLLRENFEGLVRNGCRGGVALRIGQRDDAETTLLVKCQRRKEAGIRAAMVVIDVFANPNRPPR